MKKSYRWVFIALMLFVVSCDCGRDPVDPQHYWVICSHDSLTGTDSAVLTNGTDTHYSGQLFDPNQWSCPNSSGSPIWNGSGRAVYGTQPISSSNQDSTGSSPANRPEAKNQAAATDTSNSFLPPLLLDLPFPARRAGSEATALACDSSQPDIFMVNHERSSVNRISTCPFKPVATIPVVSRPLQIAITPDGKTALVTSFDGAVNFIDLSSNQVVFTLSTPGLHPNGIAITQDGATAYVTSFVPSNASLFQIDLASRRITTTTAVAAYPQNVFLSPDDAQLYITFPYGNSVVLMDTLTSTVSFTLTVSAPRGIAFNSKGTKAYIASAGNADAAYAPGAVLQFNTNTFEVDKTYNVGVGPNDIAVLYGDQFVVVNNYEGRSMSKIDTIAGTVSNLPVNGTPVSLSIVK